MSLLDGLQGASTALSSLQGNVQSAPVPAPVLAQRIYRDATRADELVLEAAPVHPAFMPVSFKGLSQ